MPRCSMAAFHHHNNLVFMISYITNSKPYTIIYIHHTDILSSGKSEAEAKKALSCAVIPFTILQTAALFVRTASWEHLNPICFSRGINITL